MIRPPSFAARLSRAPHVFRQIFEIEDLAYALSCDARLMIIVRSIITSEHRLSREISENFSFLTVKRRIFYVSPVLNCLIAQDWHGN